MCAGFIVEKVVVPIVIAAVSLFGGYWLVARIRRNQVQVERRMAVVEKMAAALQEDRERRTRIREWFKGNFRNVPFADAVSDFRRSNATYEDMYEEIAELQQATARLWTARRDAEIYLDDPTIAEVESYIALTRVTWKSSPGIVDNFHDEFFKKLLDPVNTDELSKKYGSAFAMLRSAAKRAA
jgi:hypothetical protein